MESKTLKCIDYFRIAPNDFLRRQAQRMKEENDIECQKGLLRKRGNLTQYLNKNKKTCLT